jgi:phosphohistidine phosphatase
MKTLYIIRHAKTNNPPLDADRILTEPGMERTRKLGTFLRQQNCQIQRLISSSAVRAIQTATIIAEQIGFAREQICASDSLYCGADQDTYFRMIIEQDNTIDSLMIVGHNPEITNVVQFFIPDCTSYMQTGSCYCIDFLTHQWQTIFTAERIIRFYERFV